MAIQLTDATVIVNNETIGVIPNSVKFDEGLGEQKLRSVSVGGGKTEQVYAQDVETKFSMLKFDVPTTVDNIRLAREWKLNGNANVAQITAENADGNVIRTFTGAAITNNYEVDMSVDGNISIEITSNSAT